MQDDRSCTRATLSPCDAVTLTNLENTMSVLLLEVPVAQVVDQLGLLKADQAVLATKADELKAQLIEVAAGSKESSFDGRLFRATVSFASKRVTDYKAVIAELAADYGIPQDIVDARLIDHTEIAEGVPTVRVSAKKVG